MVQYESREHIAKIQIAPAIAKGCVWFRILDDSLEALRWNKFDIKFAEPMLRLSYKIVIFSSTFYSLLSIQFPIMCIEAFLIPNQQK